MDFHQSFRFFDLPPELREKILSYCVVFADPINFDGLSHLAIDDGVEVDVPGGPLDIFKVNSDMYHEASALFYSQNHFRLNLSLRIPLSFGGDTGFLSPTQVHRRRRVRTLDFHISLVGGEFQKYIAPALSDMALCGFLRNLSIHIHGKKTEAGDKRGFEHKFRSPPFQLLWKLLADPYLDNVHLFAHAHYSRPLYNAFGDWILLDPADATISKLKDRDQDANFHVALDHRALVRAYSSEPEILRIGDRLPTC